MAGGRLSFILPVVLFEPYSDVLPDMCQNDRIVNDLNCLESYKTVYGLIMKQRIVSCPQCGKSVPWSEDNRFRPFCSERCKTVDLAQWAQESYRIPQTEDKIKSPDQ